MVTRGAWLHRLEQHPDCPQGRGQLAVLTALADQLDARTGQGTASVLDVAKAAGVSDRTAKRALVWAKTADLLEQTRRGHHLWDGTGAPSRWRLLAPRTTQGDSQRDRHGAKTATAPRGRGRASQLARCRVCHQPLDPDPAAASAIHPNCAPDDAPDPFAPRRVIPPEDSRRNAAAARAALEAAISKSGTTTRRTP